MYLYIFIVFNGFTVPVLYQLPLVLELGISVAFQDVAFFKLYLVYGSCNYECLLLKIG